MVRLFRKSHFVIYGTDNAYIVHNIRKEFSEGHTHLNHFNTAKFVIDLSIHKSLPSHRNRYILVSLFRLAEDPKYKNKIKELLDSNNKGGNPDKINHIKKKKGGKQLWQKSK
jgi:hypothetical protein